MDYSSTLRFFLVLGASASRMDCRYNEVIDDIIRAIVLFLVADLVWRNFTYMQMHSIFLEVFSFMALELQFTCKTNCSGTFGETGTAILSVRVCVLFCLPKCPLYFWHNPDTNLVSLSQNLICFCKVSNFFPLFFISLI